MAADANHVGGYAPLVQVPEQVEVAVTQAHRVNPGKSFARPSGIEFPTAAQADVDDLLARIARIEELQRTLSSTPMTDWKPLVAELKAEAAEYAAAATRLRGVIGISDAPAASDESVATPEMTSPPDGVVVP